MRAYGLLTDDAVIALTCRMHGMDAIAALDEDFWTRIMSVYNI